jgi:MerR family transcriptional regulator, copper efflux regulator
MFTRRVCTRAPLGTQSYPLACDAAFTIAIGSTSLLQGLKSRGFEPWPLVTGLTVDPGPGSKLGSISPASRCDMQDLGIGELARRAGVGIDTVRYYERAGMLAPHTRLPSGYRRYRNLELARLRFIRRAQGLGFTLAEIKSLLKLSAQSNIAQVKRSAQAKLEDVERRIAHLQRVRDGLAELVSECPGHGRADDCPILRSLGAAEVQ